jgi:hypothetical protein
VWNGFCISAVLSACNSAAEKAADHAAENDMKIYLLVMIIGSLLTAIHYTSAPDKSKTLPQ